MNMHRRLEALHAPNRSPIGQALYALGAEQLWHGSNETPYGVIRQCTPEIAAQLLELVPDRQRSRSAAHCSSIGTAMEEDRFFFTGDPIKFTQELENVDGQHRLQAQVDAGVTRDVFVCIVPIEAFEVIDATCRTRSLMQLATLNLDKSVHTTVIAALVTEYCDFPIRPTQLTKDQKIRIVAEHPLRDAATALRHTKTGKRPNSGLIAGAVRCLAKNEACAMKFFRAAFNNEHEVDGVKSSPAKELAMWMYTRTRAELHAETTFMAVREEAARAINAYNAHVTGRELKLLKGCTGDTMPKPVK